MLFLGIDTSGVALSVVLTEGEDVIARRSFTERRGQTEALLPLVEACLAEGTRPLTALRALAVVTGPGSFTGLRLGIAAAQGLGRALGCPVAGFDRFALLGQAPLSGVGSRTRVIVLESFREELFVAFGREAPTMLPPPEIRRIMQHVTPSDWVVTGDGAPRLLQEDNRGEGEDSRDTDGLLVIPSPDGAELAARTAAAYLARGAPLPPARPFYLRAPDVTLSRPLRDSCPA